MQQQKAAYILLHGAWHNSWCWRYVVPLLEQLGHKVIAPDLPGHGKKQMSFVHITLATYLDEISGLINSLGTPVVLVGHSMAGVIISQLAENLPDKIMQLIYVAAFIPDDQECLLQEAKKSPDTGGIGAEMIIDKQHNSIVLKKSPRLGELFYNTCSPADAELAVAHLQPEPFQPFLDAVTLSAAHFGAVNKTYVECGQDKIVPLAAQKRMQAKTSCKIISLDTDHSPFLSAPAQLVKAIMGK